MDSLSQKLKDRIRAQLEQPISEILHKELVEWKSCQNKARSALKELNSAAVELKGLLSQANVTLPENVNRAVMKTVGPPTGLLAEMLLSADLRVVDIGGRLGPLSQFSSLIPFCSLFICEPDPKAQEALRESFQSKQEGYDWRRVIPFSEALGLNSGTVSLNITKQPGLSSLLVPNSEMVRTFYSTDDWQVLGSEQVPSLTLDAAGTRYDFGSPLFLKLDTQGTELEILKSGPSVLKDTVGVYLEVNNLDFYQGQSSFGETDSFLRENGFTLVDLKRTTLRRENNTRPMYSKRELGWSHALYLRLGGAGLNQLEKRFAGALFTLAVCLEYFDLAVSILEHPELGTEFPVGELGALKSAVCTRSEAVFRRISANVTEEYRDALLLSCFRDRKWER
jgi:FkbM family methyltransferase